MIRITQTPSTDGGHDPLHGLLLGGAAAWCAAVVLAPALDLSPLYAFFSAICHQLPERSWLLAGGPLAVCIRCASIYAGFLLGLAGRAGPRPRLLKLAVSITALDVAAAYLGADFAAGHALSGLLLGIAGTGVVEHGIRQMLGRWAWTGRLIGETR